MNVLEHEEVEVSLDHPRKQPVDLRPKTLEVSERRMVVVGVVWQVFRVLLLAWSLLCFYCGLRLCLGSLEVDFVSVASNLIIGLLAWIAACRIGQPVEWVEEDETEVVPVVDAK
jgi:hypothetical protein